jgi:hypothetical protein
MMERKKLGRKKTGGGGRGKKGGIHE